MKYKYCKKNMLRAVAVLLLVAILEFSNFAAVLLNKVGLQKVAENLAIKEAQAAAPTFVAAGTAVGGAGAVTPGLPAGIVVNDILLMFIETANQAISIPIPNGGTWIQVLNSPQGTGIGGGTATTRITVFWSRYNGTQGAPTTSDSGDHQVARILAFRGVITIGDPWDVTSGSADATSDTNLSVPGATTSVPDTLVVIAAALMDDAQNFGATWTNADLTSITVRSNTPTAAGNDGRFGVVTGVKATAGIYGATTNTLTAPSVKGRMTIALKPPILTIGATAGAKAATLNSGDIFQYINITSCASASACSAFTLSLSSGSETVTSIKITEASTTNANADLSNIALFYDTDGNFSNGVIAQYGATTTTFGADETATITGSLVISSGTTYYFYIRFALRAPSSYPKGGQQIQFRIAANGDVGTSGTVTKIGAPAELSGTTTILPNATSTTFGAGLTDGGRSGESITISGAGFGAAPGGSRANCAGAVDTGCVRFIVGGAATVGDADVTSWSNTSITFNINASLASQGGTNGLEAVAGGQGDGTDLTFFIYPKISSLTVPTGFLANTAREYNAGDTDGLLQINGDHLGITASTVQILSVISVIHATAEGPCTVSGWTSTGICAEASTAIPDSAYTGTVQVTRGSDSKTASFSSLRILPRITGNSPISGAIGEVIQLAGNHFCQSGTCPTGPDRSSATSSVSFGITQALEADFVNQTGGAGACNGTGASWTHSEICVEVPSGTPTGSQPTHVTSTDAGVNYGSNSRAFSVVGNTPIDPTNLEQRKLNQTFLATGATTTETSIVLEADLSATLSVTMILEVEVQPISTAFNGTISATSSAVTGTSFPNMSATATGLVDGTEYHWRARAKNTTTGEVSNWVVYGGNADGPPADTDFSVDASGPVISAVSAGTPTDLAATITWTTNESADEQIKRGAAGGTCPPDADPATRYGNLASGETVPTTPAGSGTSHSRTFSNLSFFQTYQYMVRSADSVGNVSYNPATGCNSFTTAASVTRIMRTISYPIAQLTPVTVTSVTTTPFRVLLSETNVTVTSAHIEVSGVTIGTGASNPTLAVNLNAQATTTHAFPNSSSPIPFTIRYKLPSLTVSCAAPVEAQNAICANGTSDNTFYIKFGGGFTRATLVRAKLWMTYHYTP